MRVLTTLGWKCGTIVCANEHWREKSAIPLVGVTVSERNDLWRYIHSYIRYFIYMYTRVRWDLKVCQGRSIAFQSRYQCVYPGIGGRWKCTGFTYGFFLSWKSSVIEKMKSQRYLVATFSYFHIPTYARQKQIRRLDFLPRRWFSSGFFIRRRWSRKLIVIANKMDIKLRR